MSFTATPINTEKRYETRSTKHNSPPPSVADSRGIGQILWDVSAGLVVEGVNGPSAGVGEGRGWDKALVAGGTLPVV